VGAIYKERLEMGSGAMTYIPDFIDIGSCIEMLMVVTYRKKDAE
jgi:hypothetical protein